MESNVIPLFLALIMVILGIILMQRRRSLEKHSQAIHRAQPQGQRPVTEEKTWRIMYAERVGRKSNHPTEIFLTKLDDIVLFYFYESGDEQPNEETVAKSLQTGAYILHDYNRGMTPMRIESRIAQKLEITHNVLINFNRADLYQLIIRRIDNPPPPPLADQLGIQQEASAIDGSSDSSDGGGSDSGAGGE